MADSDEKLQNVKFCTGQAVVRVAVILILGCGSLKLSPQAMAPTTCKEHSKSVCDSAAWIQHHQSTFPSATSVQGEGVPLLSWYMHSLVFGSTYPTKPIPTSPRSPSLIWKTIGSLDLSYPASTYCLRPVSAAAKTLYVKIFLLPWAWIMKFVAAGEVYHTPNMPSFESTSLARTGPSPFLSIVPRISVMASSSAACIFRYVKGGGTSRPLLKKVYVLVPGVHQRFENQGWSEPDRGSIAGCVVGTSEGCKKL